MAANGTSNGTNGVNVSGWKHYNEGTFLFTVSLLVSLPPAFGNIRGAVADRYSVIPVRVCR
jgi:hypothetical protein